jgi:hypothetical protein
VLGCFSHLDCSEKLSNSYIVVIPMSYLVVDFNHNLPASVTSSSAYCGIICADLSVDWLLFPPSSPTDPLPAVCISYAMAFRTCFIRDEMLYAARDGSAGKDVLSGTESVAFSSFN